MSVKQDEQCEWCEKQEKLLIKWAEKAAGYRWLHNHARLFYKKQNDWLAYPSIVIASITGVGGFVGSNLAKNLAKCGANIIGLTKSKKIDSFYKKIILLFRVLQSLLLSLSFLLLDMIEKLYNCS